MRGDLLLSVGAGAICCPVSAVVTDRPPVKCGDFNTSLTAAAQDPETESRAASVKPETHDRLATRAGAPGTTPVQAQLADRLRLR